MSFSQALSLISQALIEAFGWFNELMTDSFWLALITIFGIYTAARLLLMPLIGKSGSDTVKKRDD